MGALPRNSSVLVLNTLQADATRVGLVVRGVPGVYSVTADPDRGQIIVHYDPTSVAARNIRTATEAPIDEVAEAGFWFRAWPRLASALPTAAGLL